MMQYAPKDCQPTILDLQKEKEAALQAYLKRTGKKLEELTEQEKAEASQVSSLEDPCDAYRD